MDRPGAQEEAEANRLHQASETYAVVEAKPEDVATSVVTSEAGKEPCDNKRSYALMINVTMS